MPSAEAAPRIRTGGCLCGAVRFETHGEPIIVVLCQCRDCQRHSGAGHGAGAVYPASAVEITGALGAFTTQSAVGSQVTRRFCPTCASPIHGENDKSPGHVTMALGGFDDPSAFAPEAIVYTRSGAAWDHIDPALPAFETQPEWRPPSKA